MKSFYLALAMLLLVGGASAQTQTPNLGLWQFPHNFPNYDVMANGNMQTLDNLFALGTCGVDGIHALSYDATLKKFGCNALSVNNVSLAPLANQTITGAHALNLNGGTFSVTDDALVPIAGLNPSIDVEILPTVNSGMPSSIRLASFSGAFGWNGTGVAPTGLHANGVYVVPTVTGGITGGEMKSFISHNPQFGGGSTLSGLVGFECDHAAIGSAQVTSFNTCFSGAVSTGGWAIDVTGAGGSAAFSIHQVCHSTDMIQNGGVPTDCWWTGTGSPNSVVSAAVGSFYAQRDGGAGTSMWFKESGSGNTGWLARSDFTGSNILAAGLNLSGLTASLPVCTDGSKNLTTTSCLTLSFASPSPIGSTTPNTGVFTTLNGAVFALNGGNTVQQAMTAASTNGLSQVQPTYSGGDIPTGTQVNDINTPSSSSQSVGAHVLDYRYGGVLSLFNPPTTSVSPSNVSIPSGVIGNFTQLPSAATGYNEYMFGLQLNAFDGGSNINQNGLTNKTTWASLIGIVNGWAQGQHIGGGATVNGYGAGDNLAWNMTVNSWGGANAGSDEGAHLGDWAVQSGNVMYTGVVASGGTAGSTSVTVTNSLGNKTNGSGRPLLDVTAGTGLTITTITGSGPLTFTASGTPFTSGSSTTDSTAITTPGSQTINVGSTTGITANTTLVCIYDAGSQECVIPTAVSAGVSITANFRKTYGSGANLAWGSPQIGEYIVLTPDCWSTTGAIAFTNVLNTLCQAWPVVGAPSTSTITVWYNTASTYGAYGGNAKAAAGSNAATIYPGTEVISVQSGGTISNTMTMAPNTVTFGTHNVEQPFGPQKMEMTNTQVFKAFHTPGSIAFGAGYQISGNANGGDCLWCITDGAANTLYTGHSGNEVPPLAFLYLRNGLVRNGIAFDEFPDTDIISSGCPVNTSGAVDCTLSSDDLYKIVQLDGNGGKNYLSYNPNLGNFRVVGGGLTKGWKFDGATGDFLAQNGGLGATTYVSGATYKTATNCAAVGTAASPSVAACGSAAAGHFSCATNATGATCTVNTTAVTASSEIFVFESDTTVTGTALGVTCNTSTNVLPASRLLASSIAATSFTINLGTVTTNPACFSYEIKN